mmetsp:Transcript_17560/g.30970  ORF Transcript_17560/g.30970 Transcript_17560/m.30970 type:complete len:468 (+) Transcript_17560:174-1577(+)|eukprot:CAMPEP_0184509110 /NCGR_PEP_ID=MMETSP0198_2-20121128/1110_1 /TAXON_ID=1112570 /ORGANISM="Thraustochytrium sp., Strain LLF1b" /LENGTH=467 /DNA_ID=CAMNT_0026898921 /DNA_START=399 /DNA_END=1802 /DNA_ORIENTATION=-
MYPGQKTYTGPSANSVEELVQSCSVYQSQFKARITKDVNEVISQCPTLKAQTDVHYSNDGRSSTLITLKGIIPIHYGGEQYNIPMQIWVADDYPLMPPLTYVTPTGNMTIARDHDNVSPDGAVFQPYLNQWNPSRSSLAGLVSSCKSLFSSFPPVHARPPSNSGGVPARVQPPPAYTQSGGMYPGAESGGLYPGAMPSSTSYPYGGSTQSSSPYPSSGGTPPPPPYPVFGNGVPSSGSHPPPLPPHSAASSAAALTSNSEAQKASQWTKRDRELKTARQHTEIKLSEEYQKFRDQMKLELGKEMAIQKQLEEGQGTLESGIKKLEEQAKEFETSILDLKTSETQFTTWLAEYATDSSAVASQDAAVDEISLDEAIVPADALSRQLFDCVAEAHAIEDVMFQLDRALANDVIECSVFLKEVRKLSREQFKAKALANKIVEQQQRLEMQALTPPVLNTRPPAYQTQAYR